MQSGSSRIWTRVAVSNSCDDNHYTTGTSDDMICKRWVCWQFIFINKLQLVCIVVLLSKCFNYYYQSLIILCNINHNFALTEVDTSISIYCGLFVLILVVFALFFFHYVSAKFLLRPSSGDLPRPRIGMLSFVTVSPVITAFHSCCLSHHVFDQVNLWPAWVGFETAIVWQCSPGTVETQRLYPLYVSKLFIYSVFECECLWLYACVCVCVWERERVYMYTVVWVYMNIVIWYRNVIVL